jgi:hypothetical protein
VPYAHAITLLRTRREVRECLAKEIQGVIDGRSPPDLPPELMELPAGNDREVIQTSQRLDKSFGTRSVADASSAEAALGRKVRDLFTAALQRMKELPPDPREKL